jgi:NADH-quinone oxidoreductase subunit L
LSSIWLLFVTGVGMLIHIYSMGYMAHEGGYYRFFGYLNLFMFSMLTLILANNYALMFVGWEGVGLCSYLLIGFYFQRHSASTAANKAFIVNRVGDAGFLLGMFTIAWYFGSVQYTAVNHLARSGHFRHRRSRDHRRLPCCCSSELAASRRNFRSMSGCRTRWKAQRRSPR